MHKRLSLTLSTLLFLGLVLETYSVSGQAHLRGALITGMGDLATIKLKAEAGDAGAQVALADTFISKFHSVEAIGWYRKAAEQGNNRGAYELGRILLFGSPGIPKEQTVEPSPFLGVQWTFRAATNGNVEACRNMSKAYQQGLGVAPDLIRAYAWLQLAAGPQHIVAKVELNQLALKLDSESIHKAEELAAEFRRGNWESLVALALPSDDSVLKLSGISFGKTPLAIISGKTLAEGEMATIKTKTGSNRIKCLKIEKTSVTILVEGESAPRELRLK